MRKKWRRSNANVGINEEKGTKKSKGRVGGVQEEEDEEKEGKIKQKWKEKLTKKMRKGEEKSSKGRRRIGGRE